MALWRERLFALMQSFPVRMLLAWFFVGRCVWNPGGAYEWGWQVGWKARADILLSAVISFLWCRANPKR